MTRCEVKLWMLVVLQLIVVGLVHCSEHQDVYQEYWYSITHGKVNHVLDHLRWTVQSGSLEDYFRSLNYLVYIHDFEIRDSKLLRTIEDVIDNSIYENVVHSQKSSKNIIFNLIKFLMRTRNAKKQAIEEQRVEQVPSTFVDFSPPSQKSKILGSFLSYLPSLNTPHRAVITQYLQSSLPFEVMKHMGRLEQSKQYFESLLRQTISLNRVSASLKSAANFYLNYFSYEHTLFDLAQKLPTFTSPQGKRYYSLITNYMHNPQFMNLCLSSNLNLKSTSVLQDVLSILKSNAIVNRDVQTAAGYYLNYYKGHTMRSQYSLEKLFSLIPHPTTSFESKFYDSVQKFISSATVLQVIENSHVAVSSNLHQMLFDIFSCGLKSNLLSVDTKEAIVHYFKSMYHQQLSSETVQKIEYLIKELEVLAHKNGYYFKEISSFLHSDMAYLVFTGTEFDMNLPCFRLLEDILEHICNMESLWISVRQAAHFFKEEVHHTLAKETQIMTMVHDAFTLLDTSGSLSQSSQKYEMDLDMFLQSDYMHQIIRHSHVQSTSSAMELLYELLEIIEENVNVSMDIRQAAYHYSKYILEPFLGNVKFDINALLQLLPKPNNHLTGRYFNILKTYLQLGIPRFVSSQIDIGKQGMPLLCDLLQALIYSEKIPLDIKSSARFYWHAINFAPKPVDKVQFTEKLDRLTVLLPKPSNMHETQYYNLMIGYLKGNEILSILGEVSINLHKTDVRILRDVLVLTLNNRNVYMDVKTVARFYLNMIDNGAISDISTLVENHDYNFNIEEDQGAESFGGYQNHFAEITSTAGTGYAANHYNYGSDIKGTAATTTRTYKGNTASTNYGGLRKTKFGVVANAVSHGTTASSGAVSYNTGSHSTTAATSTSTGNHIGSTSTTQSLGTTSATTLHNTHTATAATSGTTASSGTAQRTLGTIAATAAAVETSAATAATSLASSSGSSSSTSSGSTSSTSSTMSTITSTSSTKTNTKYSVTLTEKQTEFLKGIESALDTIDVTDSDTENLQVLKNYLHTDMAINLLETAGIDMNQSTEDLLAEFVDIAAHTSDIPTELRVASEKYILLIPKLRSVSKTKIHIHLKEVDNFFHLLKKPEAQDILILYNAADRYLHSEVPSIILMDTTIDLSQAPRELLHDLVHIAEELQVSSEVIQNLIQSNGDYHEVSGPTLDHLYRLDKVFQLVEVPEEKESMDYYYTFSSYLRSNFIYDVLQKNDVDFNLDLKDLYHKILELSMSCTSLTMDIVQSAIYFYNVMFTTKMDHNVVVDNVFKLITTSESPDTKEMYETINEYIHSDQAQPLLDSMNLDTHRRPTSILIDVLDLTTNKGGVDNKVRHAANYLLNSMTTTTTTMSTVASSKKSSFSHHATHTMQSLSATTAATVSRYAKLLNIVSDSFKTTSDFTIIEEYFQGNTLDTLFEENDFAAFASNEEAFLRAALSKTVHFAGTPISVRTACAHLIKQRYYDFSLLISQLPAASFDVEQGFYTSLSSFFSSEEAYYYLDLEDTKVDSTLECLHLTLARILASGSISSEVRTSAGFYLNHSPFFDYGILVSLLPVATSENVLKLHSTMTSFLQSNLVNRCTLDINVGDFAGHNDQLLRSVLVSAESCDLLDESIRVAAKYYLTVIKSVAVSVQKVLTKTLDLSEIFTDAFDFSTFSKNQFDAYHIFLTYVSSHTEELLSSASFDFWTETKQRGEFTFKFLDALGKYPNTPAEILQDVEILKPLVMTENTGAYNV